jgi:hypothetical protein
MQTLQKKRIFTQKYHKNIQKRDTVNFGGQCFVVKAHLPLRLNITVLTLFNSKQLT